MIEQVLISGKLGKALYRENEQYFLVGAEEASGPWECRPGDLALLEDCRPNFYAFVEPQVDLGKIRKKLLAERTAHRALSLVLGGMDKILSEETRALSIEAAEEALQEHIVFTFVRNRLLARALPREADAEGALALADGVKTAVATKLYREVVDRQAVIKPLLDVWQEVAMRFLRDPIAIENLFIETGVFAEAVSAVAEKNLQKLNLLVVKFGNAFASNKSLVSQASSTVFINAFKNQLVQTFNLHYVEPQQAVRIPKLPVDPIAEMLKAYDPRKHSKPQRRKTLRADEAKDRVDRQIKAIEDQILNDDISHARKYLFDLIKFQLEQGKLKYLGMTLCNLAQKAIAANALLLGEALINYALLLRVEDPVIFCAQAELKRKQGSSADALAAYDATIAQFPTNVVAQNGRAEVLKELNRFEDALAAYDATIAQFP
ncbi:hypothetical protein HUU40_03150, partial [candidate division KSB1 bacterium]|nr:hypothetical protein [candidate division KSB1 bacterium]